MLTWTSIHMRQMGITQAPISVVEVAEALHAVEVALCADDERLSQYIIVGCSELVRFIAGGGQKVRPSHGFRYAQTIR